jgi:N utilization substance protein A
MEIKSLEPIISMIAEERGIPKEKVLESLEYAIAAAYKKDYGKKGQVIRAKIDLKKGEISFWQVKLVVDKDKVYFEKAEKEDKKDKIKFNPEKHILLEEAQKINSNIKVGEELILPLKVQKEYGRIAAQTARQVILQKIKEIEKETIFNEYKAKEGQAISGIVQRIEGKNVILNIGKTMGILTKEEQVPGEFYRLGQRLKVYVLKVESTSKGPVVFLSRSHPKLVSKLFEQEVPEIASGQVKINSIAREPGLRTKIAVSSNVKGLDPIGAMVGYKGTRVQIIINELGGEKIDIIEYSDDPKKYIANALSPAKILGIEILSNNKAVVTVPQNQLSLAIGKDGQNVRLASKLTGWRIDVKAAEE